MATLMATLGLDSQGFDRGLNSSTEKIKSWAQAFGLVLSAGTIANLTKQAIDLADGFDRMALRTGLSREAVQEWSFVVTNSKANVRDFEAAVVALATRMTRQPELFEKYGIAIRNTDGTLKSVEEVLRLVSQRMGAATGESEKNAIAMDTMAEAGRKLVIALGQNEEVISELIAKAPLMRDATVRALAEMQQSIDNLKLDSIVTIGNILGGLQEGSGSGLLRSVGEVANILARLGETLLGAAAGFVDLISRGIGEIVVLLGNGMLTAADRFIAQTGRGLQSIGELLPDFLGGQAVREAGAGLAAFGSSDREAARAASAARTREIFATPGELMNQGLESMRQLRLDFQADLRREETTADTQAPRIAAEFGNAVVEKAATTGRPITDVVKDFQVDKDGFLRDVSKAPSNIGVDERGVLRDLSQPDAIAQVDPDGFLRVKRTPAQAAASQTAAAQAAAIQAGAQATPSTAQQVGAGAQVNPAATMYVDLTGRSLALLEGRYKAQ